MWRAAGSVFGPLRWRRACREAGVCLLSRLICLIWPAAAGKRPSVTLGGPFLGGGKSKGVALAERRGAGGQILGVGEVRSTLHKNSLRLAFAALSILHPRFRAKTNVRTQRLGQRGPAVPLCPETSPHGAARPPRAATSETVNAARTALCDRGWPRTRAGAPAARCQQHEYRRWRAATANTPRAPSPHPCGRAGHKEIGQRRRRARRRPPPLAASGACARAADAAPGRPHTLSAPTQTVAITRLAPPQTVTVRPPRRSFS